MRIRSMPASGGVRRPITLIVFAIQMCLTYPAAGAEPGQPASVLSIELVDHMSGEMALYKVVMTEKVPTADLDGISRRIKRTAPKTKLLFISFLLRDTEQDGDTWATSSFNPALDGFVVRVKETAPKPNPTSADLPFAVGQ
jgi:hypothetical protein